MKDSVFAILHEGKINKIDGSLPGTLWLDIQCDYLRTMINKTGNSFKIKIHHCSQFSYTSTSGQVVTDFKEIEELRPVLLSTDMIEEEVIIFCENGVLNILFSDLQIFVNEKETISVDDLEDIASEYWDEVDTTSKSLAL